MNLVSAFPRCAGFALFSLRELMRQPTYILTTLIFPSMFFAFFGVPNAQDADSAKTLMASFAAFAVLGVSLFQTTVSVAQDRASAWNLYLRSLPVPTGWFLTGQLLASLVLAATAVLLVMFTARLTTPLEMGFIESFSFLFWVLVGGIPFAALGICLGSLTRPKAAVPVANLVYLPLSFAGGLWIPPQALSPGVQEISEFLPTRFYGEIVWAFVLGQPLALKWALGLGAYALGFLVFAVWLYRRDLGERFG